MRLTSWNILHGMAIGAAPVNTLVEALRALRSDVFAFQEVDHYLPRSQTTPQIRDLAEAIGARYWAMAPSVIGTPGEKWRQLSANEPDLITQQSSHSELALPSYGIAMASTIEVIAWRRLNLGRSPIGMPLIVPGEETGRGKPRFIYVADEPRVALAAVLENGWTIINTHLSFVPGLNLWQLKKIKKWAIEIEKQTGTRSIIVGDLNLPKNIPVIGSDWKSLTTQNTYPSWSAKIQFDYILSRALLPAEYSVRKFAGTGISDHWPIGIEIH